jgi:excisionase family DNA binding protein
MAITVPPANNASSNVAPRFIRVKEGARYCALSPSELYRAIYTGELHALRYRSRSWLLTREDIDAWIASQSTPNDA